MIFVVIIIIFIFHSRQTLLETWKREIPAPTPQPHPTPHQGPNPTISLYPEIFVSGTSDF